MIISVIDGGLGNQMFQYAFLKALSKHYQCSDICVDIVSYDNNDGRSYLLDRFNISETIIYSKNNKHNKAFYRLKRFLVKKIHRGISKRVFIEVKMFSYDARVFENRAVRYEGFWQSYKYFNKIRPVLLKEFTLKSALNEYSNLVLSSITTTKSISVHVRRGDYVDNRDANDFHGTCDLEYYVSAIDYIKSFVANPVFYFFSDDIGWVKDVFFDEPGAVFIDGNFNNPEFDLELMRSCRHNIIANSTFSWWGAWLNSNISKIVIAPVKWTNKKYNTRDLIPDDWVRL